MFFFLSIESLSMSDDMQFRHFFPNWRAGRYLHLASDVERCEEDRKKTCINDSRQYKTDLTLKRCRVEEIKLLKKYRLK